MSSSTEAGGQAGTGLQPRPTLLDLFCGAGGAAMGYYMAGFDVIGVDTAPQPHYPFPFLRADALMLPVDLIRRFDAVHASPPCQHYSTATAWRGSWADHPDHVDDVRRLLVDADIPWVIENVPGAPLRPTYVLCGSQFGLPFRRHRLFETSAPFGLVSPCHHRPTDLAFEHKAERAYADAIGVTWMSKREGRDAVPPIYTEFIGEQLLAQLAGGLTGTGLQPDGAA